MSDQEPWFSKTQKCIISWGIMVVMGIVGPALIFAYLWGLYNLLMGKNGFFAQHFPALMGLPAVSVCAYVIVVTLRHAEGPIEFGGPAFNFKGTSGEVVLWLLCTLGLAAAIKMLW
jgi:hypothetical protein